MSFVFFVLICSFAKYVQHRRFCAEVGQNCDLLSSFFVLFCCFCRIWSTKCPQTENKKEQKNHAAGKIARCPLSFLLLDPPPPPPPPPLKHETSYYPILILNVISRAVNSKSLLHVIFGDFVKFHCLIQALFFLTLVSSYLSR